VKKPEVWQPKEVEIRGKVFKVGDRLGKDFFIKKDSSVRTFEYPDGIIEGFEKQHYRYMPFGPSIDGGQCDCSCHEKGSEIEEPCEKCKSNDQDYLVKILIFKTAHICNFTKNERNKKQ